MERQASVDENDKELLFINVVEETVKIEVKKLFKSMDMCNCNKCYLDACAIALNALTPYYVTTSKGALFKKIETYNSENQTKVIVEATKAVLAVKERPWHEHEFKVVNS